MMNRRNAIMAALIIGARCSIGQEFRPMTGDQPLAGVATADVTVMEFDVVAVKGVDMKAFRMHYRGRTAIVSMDEVMDALGATVDEPGK